MTNEHRGTVADSVMAARRALLQQRTEALRALTAEWQKIGNIRLGLFALVVACAVWWLSSRSTVALSVGGLVFIAFLVLVFWHRSISQRRKRAVILTASAQETVWRLERNWDELPIHHEFRPEPTHPFAADLDLFGRGSLMQLLDVTVTPVGRATLGGWLMTPAEPETVRDRQAAVRELAELTELRDELVVEPRLAGGAKASPEAFLAWATGDRWFDGKGWLIWVARISPILLFGLIAAQLLGAVRYPLWVIPLAANLLIAQFTAGEVSHRIQQAGSQRGALKGYAALLRLLNDHTFHAPLLVRLSERVKVEGRSPADSLGWLARISRWWMPRSSLAYLPAQGFLAWDLNHLSWLERWQKAVGGSTRVWLDTAGELEALTAIANLSADHPDWCFPDLDPSAESFAAIELGHPLLPDDQRVTNDIQIGPQGTFLLVTGSNMSGKSTLLRSAGITIVMANMGSAVCAEQLSLPPLSLWTSVRVQDSLAQGVSFFMAELLRLKQIVDAANTASVDDRRVCFILDEMLQGTNTAERQIAARRIIQHLVERGSIGAVSTHDLTLADGPEIAALAIPVHLTETVEETADGPAMVFDYKVRPGIATSTNALRLMDVVGFEFGDEPASHLSLKRTFGDR
jgi:hypothetical protein